MKTFKKIDYNVQLVLVVLAVFCAVAFGLWMENSPLFYAYYMVAGWQMISVIVHLFAKNIYKSDLRKIYHVFLLLAMVMIVLSIIYGIEAFFLVLVLIYWLPAIALFYLYCCYVEVKKMPAAKNTAGETQAAQVKHEEKETGQSGAGL